MATTTTTATFSVTGDNIYYDTPDDYSGENDSYILTTHGTISGTGDDVEVEYGTNDVLIVTGVNDEVADYSYSGDGYGFGHALIDAHTATGFGEYSVEGPDSTILAGGANDSIYSYGGYTQTTETSSTTTGGTTVDNSQVVTTVGNTLYGEAGDDHIYIAYADTVYGGAGNDTIVLETDGVDAAPTYSSGHLPGAYIDGGVGDDYISLTGTQYVGDSDSSEASGGSYEYSTILGGDGNDTIVGGDYNFESIDGGTGNNLITDVGDNASIYAGAGNDTITEVGSYAYIQAGDGANVIGDVDSFATIYSGSGNDLIQGVGYGSFIESGAGDDTIQGVDAESVIYGQAGNDIIFISGYGNVVFGGAGNDIITASGDDGDSSYNFISADLGNDTVDLSASYGYNNTVYGGGGDDTIYGSQGANDQIYGQSGNDTIYLNGANDVVYGGAGNDLIYDQGNNNSFISGDLGDDSIFASGHNDIVYGGDGNDSILATASGDSLYGNAGNDHITVTLERSESESGTATVFGGAGDDHITVTYTTTTQSESYTGSHDATLNNDGYNYGDNGTYIQTTVTEGDGAHYLSGDLGNDTIIGGSGGDTFVGGAGADILISHRMEATGNDPLAPGYEGGGANDSFVFHPNDSYGGNPAGTGTGSDITNSGGEAGLDHITGFQLNVTGQAYNAGTDVGSTGESYVNHQDGDNLYFLSAAHSSTGATSLDTNVFYGTVDNSVPGSTATEASDYAVAYAYAFGVGGTAAAPTAGAAFANAADYIVVDVVDNGVASTNNGNVFVFDHNGNAVALDGAGLGSTGTTGTFQDSTNPLGGLPSTEQNGVPNSVTTVNIYH